MKPPFATRRWTSLMSGLLIAGTQFHLHVAALDAADAPVFCKHGNWLRISTMWIGVHNRFERRVGMFPAGFDREGRMFTDTAFGDYPQVLPSRPGAVRLPSDNVPKWMLVSEHARCTASSFDAGHPAQLGSDENVRTWWAAASDRAGEWLAMDLGEEHTIHAVQVNLAEHDVKQVAQALANAGQSFIVEVSDDGETWKPVWDRSRPNMASAHPLHLFEAPIRTRHMRLVNATDSAAGAFAVRDLAVRSEAQGWREKAARHRRASKCGFVGIEGPAEGNRFTDKQCYGMNASDQTTYSKFHTITAKSKSRKSGSRALDLQSCDGATWMRLSRRRSRMRL